MHAINAQRPHRQHVGLPAKVRPSRVYNRSDAVQRRRELVSIFVIKSPRRERFAMLAQVGGAACTLPEASLSSASAACAIWG
jgi:hypothetical protein